MKSVFEKYVQQADSFISEVAAVTSAPQDLERAEKLLSAFFRALRGRIAPEESMHFVSQLPMMLKAIYVDGWKLSHVSKGGKGLEDFVQEVKANYGPGAGTDLGNDRRTVSVLINLVAVLRNYVSDGELEDIRAELPEEIAALFNPIDVL